MIRYTITSYADQNLTQEAAQQRLPSDKVLVAWYTNREVRQSVVHFHPYHEFLLMVSGQAMYLTNGSRYHLHPGEMMLIPPGMAHSGYYDTYDRLILQIDDAFWRETLEMAGMKEEADSKPLDFLIISADATYHWGMRALFERFAAAASIQNAAKKERLYRCQLVELALVLWQIVDENQLRTASSTNALVAKTAAYLQEHYRDSECNVTQLAQNAYVSREHLSRVFRKYMMESISEYLTSLRMQGCRQSLAEGKSVLDACMENGFSNYSSFLKSFRKRYGVTPTEYRAQLEQAVKLQISAQ